MWNALCGVFGQLMRWLYAFIPNYGVAIILFTIVLKIVLFPLAMRQQKGSMAMVRLKPYQDELMKKYGSNKQKYNEELQKLYQREGYNPMSSCLPTLIQMPLIFMMYTIVRRPLTFMAGWSATQVWQTAVREFGTATTEKGVTILDGFSKGVSITAENFNRYESQILSRLKNPPINTRFLGLDLSLVPKDVWKTAAFMILIIPILSGITSFLMSWLSQKKNPAQQAAGQNGGSMKMMMYIMPLFSLYIAFIVPAGLGLYWLTSNALGIGQLFLLNKIYDPKKEEAAVYAKIEAQKRAEKEKKSESARKKQMAVQGKKNKKKGARHPVAPVKPQQEEEKAEAPEQTEGPKEENND